MFCFGSLYCIEGLLLQTKEEDNTTHTTNTLMTSRLSKQKIDSNATVLKSLLKLPGNKYCCDCKTADHPRWASWNLGIFLCIRCSGIHRSMGTHISRVKSVDLDAWTDEQLQSMISWGNTKANVYWESQLESGHVPNDGKIDNFIKTKYVTRRWASSSERPDPDSLPGDAPKQEPKAAPKVTAPPAKQELAIDFGDFTEPTKPTPPSKPTTQPSNISLLTQPVQAPPTNPRNDLKMSIMSLYASAPRPQQPRQEPRPTNTASDLNGLFGGMNVSAAQTPAPIDPWNDKPKKESAFDDLYQTSDVWKS